MIAPDLYTKTTDNPRIREVTQDWRYNGDTVPKGFLTDGASSPRIFWGIVSPFLNPKSSCYHDYLCSIAKNKAERKLADKEYRKLVGSENSKVEKILAYAGVRIGAWLGIGNRF